MLSAVCITIGVTLVDVMVYARDALPFWIPDPQVTMGAAQVGRDYLVDILDSLS